MEISNSLLINAALSQNKGRRPVWLMRQAGRILPEYRKVRASVSGFVELVKTPELAAEVTLQPVELLGVDAAIIFSDILVIPEAMGLPYEMIPKKGPWFPKVIASKHDLMQLKDVEEQDLNYVTEAIKIVKKNLPKEVPLIGFAGAPWTIFCYMIEGQGSKTFSNARKFIVCEPELSHLLLEKITQATIKYLKAQCLAGADIIQLFDSWAGVLDKDTYHTFGLKYNEKIFNAIAEMNKPRILFPRGAYNNLLTLKNFPCEVIQLDWQTEVNSVLKTFGNSKAFQGNLDPAVLYGTFSHIEKKTKEMLSLYPSDRHIVNLGHGVYPDISPDKVKCFIETVKTYG